MSTPSTGSCFGINMSLARYVMRSGVLHNEVRRSDGNAQSCDDSCHPGLPCGSVSVSLVDDDSEAEWDRFVHAARRRASITATHGAG